MLRAGRIVAIVAGAACVAACGPRNFANENDVLRREREELRAQIADLEKRLAETDARLASAARASAGSLDSGFDPGSVALATPACTTVKIDRLSGFVGEGDLPTGLVVRVRTLDGRDRFTQVVGSITVRAERVRPGAPTVEIGSVTLDPVQVREAYRQTFTGAWYAAEVPVGSAVGQAGDAVMVTAVVATSSGERVECVQVLEGLWDRWAISKKKSSG